MQRKRTKPRKPRSVFMKEIQEEGKFMSFLNVILNLEAMVDEFNEKRKNLLLNMITDPFLEFTQRRIEKKISAAFEKDKAELIGDTIYYSSGMERIKRPFLQMISLFAITVFIIYLRFYQKINDILGHYLLLLLVPGDLATFSIWVYFYRTSYIKLLKTFHWFKKTMWEMTNELSCYLLDSINTLYRHRARIENVKLDEKENAAILVSSRKLASLEYQIDTDLLVIFSELATKEYGSKGKDFHECIDEITKEKTGDYIFTKKSGVELERKIEDLVEEDLSVPRSKIENNHILSSTALIIKALESLADNTKKYEEILRESHSTEKQIDEKVRRVNSMYEFASKILSLYRTDADKASKTITLQEIMQWFKISDVNYNLHGDHIVNITTHGDGSPVNTGVARDINISVSTDPHGDITEALLELGREIEKSNNEKAKEMYDEFCRQAEAKSLNKTVLESLWSRILSLVPTLAQASSIVLNVTKLFT